MLGQAPGFRHHALAGTAPFRPSCERHHAIGTRLVAAFDDGDVRAVRIIAAGEWRIECFFGIETQAGDAARALFELYQHVAETRVTRRPANQADVGRAVEDLLAFLLRDAAKDAEDLAFARLALELLQAVEDFLLGFIADAAGVV